MYLIRTWFAHYLNDPQVVTLALVLLGGLGIILFLGDLLAPVIASLVIAYLLEGLVQVLERYRIPRRLGVALVFLLFIATVLLVFFALIPLITKQFAQLVDNLPHILDRGQTAILRLPEKYPQFFSTGQVKALLEGLRNESLQAARRALASISLQSVVMIFMGVIYLLLVPFLVFFFLMDKNPLQAWFGRFLPKHRGLITTIWCEVDAQIGNYVRGKCLEIVIVGVVTYATFALLRLQFAALLAVATGLSVIIPFIGAAVVTVPVAIIAYFQFGPSSEFVWVLIAYGVIHALDGNVLVPVLFSEIVKLHPVAIIIAILVFGGIWGFWGVFFAIPLATLIRAIILAWPRFAEEATTPPAAGVLPADNEADKRGM
ncbi:MAG TPA: AI-2E family transporter [Nitrococcus sp.]|nr:AI-2E family transporter [Nitrococcus sp.]